MCPMMRGLDPKERVLDVSGLAFAGEIESVTLSRVAERVSSICFYHLAIPRFKAQLALYLLNERPTSNRNRFRPAIIADR
jgi:hypothetical protein